MILVTGADGFVGKALCGRLGKDGLDFRRGVRQKTFPNDAGIGDIGPETDWGPSLAGCEAVVHLAARVHVMCDTARDPLFEFRQVNVAGTINLARQAAQAGVRRFVFLSSAKVNGEQGVFSEEDLPRPQDAYANSKWEAEQGLHEMAAETGMEIVILRPPLVYGPGVGANFLRLMRSVDLGLPLPLGSVENQRSLIYVENLVDAIMVCLSRPSAAGKTYLVSDGVALSTPILIRQLAQALGRSSRLLPLPAGWIRLAGKMLGKSQEVDRLLGSLVVDNRRINRDLGWVPPCSMQEGLAATAMWYRQKP